MKALPNERAEDLLPCTGLGFGLCSDTEMRDMRNGGKSLSPESKCCKPREIGERGQLGRCEPFC